ncbi:unnamed protein product, partial [Prunus brigantina]
VFTEFSPDSFSLLRPSNSTIEDCVGFDGSWIGVSDTPNLQTLDLIRRLRSVTSAPSSEPSPQPTSAATAPAQMLQLAGGPVGSQTPASSASSVAQPVSARRRHRPVNTTNTTSTDVQEEHPRAVSAVEDGKRHGAAPTPELHSSLAHDVGHVEGCPKELEGREDSWAWLCAHFQAPDFVNKAKVNKGNRKKKTLLHHSGSRPFSYRMDARRRGGSKFPKIDVFGDVYVRPGNELAESLHVNDDGGEEPIGSSGVRLPASSRDSDRVCGSSTGCWVSDPDGDVGSDSREEAGDILSRDGECLAEGT